MASAEVHNLNVCEAILHQLCLPGAVLFPASCWVSSPAVELPLMLHLSSLKTRILHPSLIIPRSIFITSALWSCGALSSVSAQHPRTALPSTSPLCGASKIPHGSGVCRMVTENGEDIRQC